MNLTINVTERHIRDGMIRVCEQCPIALALAETAGVPEAYAGFRKLKFQRDGARWEADLPSSAMDFIDRFDDDAEVMPFSFTATFSEVPA